MNKESKIYISGASGMAGSSIYRCLKNNGYNNLITRDHNELDLTDQCAVTSFFEEEKPEYVFLAAAKVGGIKKNIDSPVEMLLDNLKIQNNIIENSYKVGVKKLLFLGSSCIYPRLCNQPMKEEYFLTGPFEPTNEGYAIAKVAGLRLCEYYNRQFKTQYISIMPCNLYGINDHYNENGHVVSSLIYKFHQAKVNNEDKVVVWGSGNQRREFMFADDMAEAAIYLMINYEENQFINVGTGVDYTIKELANIVKEIIGFKGAIEFDTSKPDGMPRKLLDITRLKQTGYKHKVDIYEGIEISYKDFLSKEANKK